MRGESSRLGITDQGTGQARVAQAGQLSLFFILPLSSLMLRVPCAQERSLGAILRHTVCRATTSHAGQAAPALRVCCPSCPTGSLSTSQHRGRSE